MSCSRFQAIFQLSDASNLHLNDLDDYSLLSVIDWLDLDSSINFASANPHARHLIADSVFKTKLRFHEKPIIILKVPYRGRPKSTIHADDDRITIDRYENVQRILSNFGNVMTNIEFDASHFNSTETIRIAELINENCFSSVQRLIIRFRSEDLAVNWTKKFESIEEMTLDRANKFGQMSYAELFPHIQSLKLEHFDNTWDLSRNLSFLEVNLPHLRNVDIDIGSSKNVNPSLFEFFRLNPQLRRFTTANFVSTEYLQFIATALPSLEELELTSYYGDFLCDRSNRTIHFDSVRSFSISLFRKPPLAVPLSFKNLRFLHLRTDSLYQPYIDFIGKCKRLETIEFGGIEDIRPSYFELKQIVDSLPQLEELRVPLEKDVNGDGISQFLTKQTQLKRITVELYAYSSNRDKLLAKLASGWKLTSQRWFLDTLTEKLTFTHS